MGGKGVGIVWGMPGGVSSHYFCTVITCLVLLGLVLMVYHFVYHLFTVFYYLIFL